MTDLYREFIALEEIAIVLQCSEDKVLALLRAGRIPGIKPGKAWVVPRTAFVTAVNGWAMEEARTATMPEAEGRAQLRDATDVEPDRAPRGRRLYTSSPEEISKG
jgi:excisionase family DNA binding protein